jgi:hypothetical protein
MIDGGAAWYCEDPSPGCPRPHPRVGSSCTTPALECDYGECAVPDGTVLKCTGGVWQQESFECGR